MDDRLSSFEVARNAEKASLVSVVVPVCNVSGYLTQCLESVLQQSYPDIEIILIDDGSTDDSGSVCDRFAQRDDRIRVIHTENRGLASARNLGLEKSRGSYLLFVDSDDWIEPHTVATLLAFAKKHNADIVAANNCDEYVGKTIHPATREKDVRIIHGDEILPCYGNGLIRDVIWNKLYLAGCFSGVRFPDGRNFEDISTTYRIMTHLAKANGTVVVLPEYLFHYRVRKSSISHTKSYCNITDGWTAWHEKFAGMPEFQRQLLPGCFVHIGHMWMFYHGFSREEKDAASDIVSEMRRFSREHFHQVMKEAYSPKIKAICLISQSSSPLLMWLCYWTGRLLCRIRKPKGNLFA